MRETSIIVCDTTLACFKAVGVFTQQALTACGWVQTSDAGQVADYGTITTIPTTAFEDWQVWAMGDTLQTTSPVFLKLEIGASPYSVPAFAFTSPSYQSFGIFIERSKDATGASTGDYTSVTCIGYQTNFHQICFKPNSYGPTIIAPTPPLLNIGTGSGSFGTALAVSPAFPMVGGYGNPLLGIISGQGVDFNEASTSVVQMYGVDHIYLSFKAGSYANFNGNHGGGCLLMRYE